MINSGVRGARYPGACISHPRRLPPRRDAVSISRGILDPVSLRRRCDSSGGIDRGDVGRSRETGWYAEWTEPLSRR